MSVFSPATRKKLRLRMALDGPSGSRKTFSALRFAFGLAGESGKVAALDTEHKAAAKYEGLSPDGIPWNFDTCELESFSPSTYTAVIKEAGRQGYDVLVIDSLSHAWEGVGGALDLVDRKGGNKFTAWKEITPMHRDMIEAILSSPCHVIVTMRSKMEYVLEENERGKQVPRKVGMAPIQRAGTEYEFDVVADLDHTHTLTVSKTRCPDLDEARAVKPGAEFIQPLIAWLGEGTEPESYAAPDNPPATADVTTPKGPAPAAGTPDPNAYSATDGDPATEAQVEAVKELCRELKVPPSDIKKALAARGVEKLAQLTVGQADGIITKLTQRKHKEAANDRF